MAMERVLGSMIAAGIYDRDMDRAPIPDEIYRLFAGVAAELSTSIETLALEWVKRFALQSRPPLSEMERQLARARFAQHIGAANLGYATGADNEDIDRDLGHEYRSTSHTRCVMP